MKGRGFTQSGSETGLVVCGRNDPGECGLCKDANVQSEYLEGGSEMINESVDVTGGLKPIDGVCGVSDRGCGMNDAACRVNDGCVCDGRSLGPVMGHLWCE